MIAFAYISFLLVNSSEKTNFVFQIENHLSTINMINNNNNLLSEEKQYRSPKTKVVFLKMQGILCSSDPKEKYITEMEEGDDNW